MFDQSGARLPVLAAPAAACPVKFRAAKVTSLKNCLRQFLGDMDFADEADIDGCPVRNLFWATDAQIEMPAAF
jgi:hypothetical protein